MVTVPGGGGRSNLDHILLDEAAEKSTIQRLALRWGSDETNKSTCLVGKAQATSPLTCADPFVLLMAVLCVWDDPCHPTEKIFKHNDVLFLFQRNVHYYTSMCNNIIYIYTPEN